MLYQRRQTGKKGGPSFAELGAAGWRLRDMARALNIAHRQGAPVPGERLKHRLLMGGPDAWAVLRWVAELLAEPYDPRQLVASWDTMAKQMPVTLGLSMGTDGRLQAAMLPTTTDFAAFALFLEVWDLIIREPKHRQRLKRCHACPTWFVDDTRGAGKDYCSETCRQRLKKQRRAKRRRGALGSSPRPAGATAPRRPRPSLQGAGATGATRRPTRPRAGRPRQ
jgi:hypothetical protein